MKMRRILVRSDFQPAIISLSLFARRSREIVLRLLLLTIFISMSANVLRSKGSSVECFEPTTAGLTHVFSCSIASRVELLRSFNSFPSNPRLRAVQTSAQASPSSAQSVSLVIDSCVCLISQQSTNTGNVERPTLIIVRITLKESKAALAGVTLQISFAIFDTLMATLSEEMIESVRFCRGASGSMSSESREESREEENTLQQAGCVGEPEP